MRVRLEPKVQLGKTYRAGVEAARPVGFVMVTTARRARTASYYEKSLHVTGSNTSCEESTYGMWYQSNGQDE